MSGKTEATRPPTWDLSSVEPHANRQHPDGKNAKPFPVSLAHAGCLGMNRGEGDAHLARAMCTWRCGELPACVRRGVRAHAARTLYLDEDVHSWRPPSKTRLRPTSTSKFGAGHLPPR